MYQCAIDPCLCSFVYTENWLLKDTIFHIPLQLGVNVYNFLQESMDRIDNFLFLSLGQNHSDAL